MAKTRKAATDHTTNGESNDGVENQPLVEAYASGGKVSIAPLQLRIATFEINGTAPYLQLKFSQKAKNKIYETQKLGEKAKSRKTRVERDFEEDYKHCMHVSEDGWYGIPATAFKCAMVSACRLAGIPMTRAKLLVHVKADGLDAESQDPLVRIEGKPTMHVGHVRNANGSADLRVRGQWKEWSAVVRVEYDETCIDQEDVLQLMYRAGRQVGIGEGRPDSKKSCGMGFGVFDAIIAAGQKSRAA